MTKFAKVIQIIWWIKSKIFYIENVIAFSQHLISLSAQVELFTDVAHIEEFLAVFL